MAAQKGDLKDTVSVNVTIKNQANNNFGVPPASPGHQVRSGRRTSDRSPAPVQHIDQPDDSPIRTDPMTTNSNGNFARVAVPAGTAPGEIVTVVPRRVEGGLLQ